MSEFLSNTLLFTLLALLVGLTACDATEAEEEMTEELLGEEQLEEDLSEKALRIATEYVYVDGHVDMPWKLWRYGHDVSTYAPWADFDYPRAKEGGLEAPFTAIYLPSQYQDERGASKTLADELIDMVEELVEENPDKFAIPHSVQDVRDHFGQGLISLPLGMENGSGLEDDLANVQHFYDRGIRYITLAHNRDNLISDSSGDDSATHGGLSDFGREVVNEMNRVGIMVDVSHISSDAALDAIEQSQVPVIASHSSPRHFTPNWRRNMRDDVMGRVAETGGVLMITWGSLFLSNEYRRQQTEIQNRVQAEVEDRGLDRDTPEGRDYWYEQRRAHPVGDVTDVADQIDYAVEMMGIEHVGLGSDWDGVFALPEGLQDASEFPNLVEELLRRDYSEEDIQKLMGENVLRVWSEAERFASEPQEDAAN